MQMTLFYNTNLERSLPAFMYIIRNYSSASGNKLNMHKCEAIALGVPVPREIKEEYGNGIGTEYLIFGDRDTQ